MNRTDDRRPVPQVPQFLYGTAWKEDQTEALVTLAIRQGFRGIDTANQRKHYHEEAVGLGIRAAILEGLVRREDLFLQTKYTFQRGQDHRLPYDPRAPISVQVEQSFASSLEHLGTERIDSYVLHGPTLRHGLTAEDWAAWHAMETIHDIGRVGMLGISNVSLDQLKSLCESARIPPRFVQNRCYASQHWDRDIRQYCKAHSIVYQGFSLLTANRDAMEHPLMLRIAKAHNRSLTQIVFRFALDIGILPLTGTTNPEHMRQDLHQLDFHITPEEMRQIEMLV